MNIMVVIQTMMKLFFILCLGYILNKTGIFDAHVNRKISSMIVNVTCPLLIISSVSSIQSDHRAFVFLLIGISFVMYFCFILAAKLITAVLPFLKKDRSVYECMCIFANTSFMGFPVIESVLGTEAIFYAAMLHMAFDLFIYTYGVFCLNKAKEENSFHLKQLISPGLILSSAAIVLYVLQLQLPDVILSTCSMIGSVTSPLSMMIIGSSLAMYPLKTCFNDLHSYLFAGVRLLLIPSVTALICRLLSIDSYYAAIAIITTGMPVASMVLMMASQFNANKEVVTRCIVVTTLLSVITIPLIVQLFIL